MKTGKSLKYSGKMCESHRPAAAGIFGFAGGGSAALSAALMVDLIPRVIRRRMIRQGMFLVMQCGELGAQRRGSGALRRCQQRKCLDR